MKNFAFTMAEILLSLTIIGVVAAITLPSLTGNINERTWNTQRKALYARFSQALALMPSLNGYGTLTEGDESTSAIDTAAETFITNGLSKVLKINNVCDAEHLADCGIPAHITPINGSIINISDITTIRNFNPTFTSANSIKLDIKTAAFETQNGESILVYYNPNCVSNPFTIAQIGINNKMCANFIYDLNGTKGPNTIGKDIGFITALYPTDPVIVAPLPLRSDFMPTQLTAGALCKKQDPDGRMPNIEELMSMSYNKRLIDTTMWRAYWSGSHISSTTGWALNFGEAKIHPVTKTVGIPARCIKR